MLLTCLKDETSRASNVCESRSIHDASATDAADSDTASRSINTSRFTYLQVIDKNGDAENARHETTAQSKTQGWKLRERKQRHQNARVETARNGNCGTVLQGVENAAQASMDSQRTTTLVIFSAVVGSLHVDWLAYTYKDK